MYTQPHDHGRVYLVPPPGSPGIRQVIDFARYGKTIPHGTLRHSSILSDREMAQWPIGGTCRRGWNVGTSDDSHTTATLGDGIISHPFRHCWMCGVMCHSEGGCPPPPIFFFLLIENNKNRNFVCFVVNPPWDDWTSVGVAFRREIFSHRRPPLGVGVSFYSTGAISVEISFPPPLSSIPKHRRLLYTRSSDAMKVFKGWTPPSLQRNREGSTHKEGSPLFWSSRVHLIFPISLRFFFPPLVIFVFLF